MSKDASSINDYRSASVPAIKQYLQCAQEQGIDWRPILEAENIRLEVLEDNNKRIPGLTMERILDRLIQACDDPCFGLHTARFIEPASYSVLGYINLNCNTFREVLANTAIYETIVGDMGVSSTHIDNSHVLLRWDCQFLNRTVRRHVIENVLASWNRFISKFGHLDTSLADSVWFEHSAPEDNALLKIYEESFNCELKFEQAASGFWFKKELLDVKLPQADKKLLKTLLDHATQLLADIDRDQPVNFRVKNLLRLMLKESEPSSAQIAERLNMSSRTLQRKLDAEGTQYKTLLNEVRLELAQYYLAHTTLSLEQIAHELGYAEARSFYRSFKQWTGQTAGAYRAEITADAGKT